MSASSGLAELRLRQPAVGSRRCLPGSTAFCRCQATSRRSSPKLTRAQPRGSSSEVLAQAVLELLGQERFKAEVSLTIRDISTGACPSDQPPEQRRAR